MEMVEEGLGVLFVFLLKTEKLSDQGMSVPGKKKKEI
jgi:hypothetical protein